MVLYLKHLSVVIDKKISDVVTIKYYNGFHIACFDLQIHRLPWRIFRKLGKEHFIVDLFLVSFHMLMPEARKRCKLNAGGITVVITLNLSKSGLRIGLVKLIQSLSNADQSD